MIYVVSGATSCLGAAVVGCLLNRGHFVYAVMRPGSKNEPFFDSQIEIDTVGKVKKIYCDFASISMLNQLISHADVFINFAWCGTSRIERESQIIQEKNVEYACKALQVASSLGCRLYSEAGSQAEYGWQDGLVTEDYPCKPFSEYGKAKYKAWVECGRLAAKLGISYAHLRIFSVFGKGKFNDMITDTMQKIFRNEPLLFTAGTQLWNFMSHTDAAFMITLLLEGLSKEKEKFVEAFNIAGDDTRPLHEFITEMCTVLCARQRPVFGSIQAGRLQSLNPSIEKTMGVTGNIVFEKFSTSVTSYYNYLKSNNLFNREGC